MLKQSLHLAPTPQTTDELGDICLFLRHLMTLKLLDVASLQAFEPAVCMVFHESMLTGAGNEDRS